MAEEPKAFKKQQRLRGGGVPEGGSGIIRGAPPNTLPGAGGGGPDVMLMIGELKGSGAWITRYIFGAVGILGTLLWVLYTYSNGRFDRLDDRIETIQRNTVEHGADIRILKEARPAQTTEESQR